MRRTGILLIALGLFAATGCNSYRLDPPAGFAEVEHNSYGARMKASDNVGMTVRIFENVRGGTLAFWSEDLVNKLGARDYVLQKQSPAKSKNGVAGTRFDFAYTTPDGDDKFYSVVLFTTNKHRAVIQVAGDAEFAARYQAELARAASSIKVKGCQLKESICNGPQPRALSTPPPKERPKIETDPAEADPSDGTGAPASDSKPPAEG